jgi:hypothetical protein
MPVHTHLSAIHNPAVAALDSVWLEENDREVGELDRWMMGTTSMVQWWT